jgi:hypothetical protein
MIKTVILKAQQPLQIVMFQFSVRHYQNHTKLTFVVTWRVTNMILVTRPEGDHSTLIYRSSS